MLSVRTLSVADAPAVARTLARIRELSDAPGAPLWTLEGVASELSVGFGFGAFAGASGADLAAFLLFRDAGLEREIMFLGTDPDWRRRGVMNELLDGFIAQSRGLGREVWLEVHRLNSGALGLYRKHGFQEVGRRHRYYADGDDAILMALRSRG